MRFASGGYLYVQRSVVGKDEDATKTEGSEEYIPLQEDLAATLGQWKAMVPSVNGWLFGNIQTGRPFWRDSLQDDHLKPAGVRIGIESLSWHNFRHTFRKMLKDLGTPLEVQMKLMRYQPPHHDELREGQHVGAHPPGQRQGGGHAAQEPQAACGKNF